MIAVQEKARHAKEHIAHFAQKQGDKRLLILDVISLVEVKD